MSARIWTALAMLAGALAGCGGEESAVGNLCIAGQEIFCRCADDSPGTQTCNADGKSLGECGPCDGSSIDDGSSPPPDDGDSGGGPGEGRPTYAACTSPADCESGMCDLGYCTKACDKPSECGYPEGECVMVGTQGRCLASCVSDDTCSTFDLVCDTGSAIDGWEVSVCR